MAYMQNKSVYEVRIGLLFWVLPHWGRGRIVLSEAKGLHGHPVGAHANIRTLTIDLCFAIATLLAPGRPFGVTSRPAVRVTMWLRHLGYTYSMHTATVRKNVGNTQGEPDVFWLPTYSSSGSVAASTMAAASASATSAGVSLSTSTVPRLSLRRTVTVPWKQAKMPSTRRVSRMPRLTS